MVGLQKIKFEKPRAKYKVGHEAELKQFYAARRRLNVEFPDGKVYMKKLSAEYEALEQTYADTYAKFKTAREDLQRLWSVKPLILTQDFRGLRRKKHARINSYPDIKMNRKL